MKSSEFIGEGWFQKWVKAPLARNALLGRSAFTRQKTSDIYQEQQNVMIVHIYEQWKAFLGSYGIKLDENIDSANFTKTNKINEASAPVTGPSASEIEDFFEKTILAMIHKYHPGGSTSNIPRYDDLKREFVKEAMAKNYAFPEAIVNQVVGGILALSGYQTRGANGNVTQSGGAGLSSTSSIGPTISTGYNYPKTATPVNVEIQGYEYTFTPAGVNIPGTSTSAPPPGVWTNEQNKQFVDDKSINALNKEWYNKNKAASSSTSAPRAASTPPPPAPTAAPKPHVSLKSKLQAKGRTFNESYDTFDEMNMLFEEIVSSAKSTRNIGGKTTIFGKKDK